MGTMLMNSENSKTSEPDRLLLNLADKINLKGSGKYAAFWNHSLYYTWKNIKQSYKDNKFKISTPTWNEKFRIPDRSYSISDIQDYFECIFKNHGQNTVNPFWKVYK